jgi:saccharopine dehydrogenase-like NADP-dependent oxidoreductase
MKRILVLGAGLVSQPLIHYLADCEDFEVTVATRTVSKAEAMVQGRPRAKAVALNVMEDKQSLEKLVSEHDLAISLLPADQHPEVAALCLKYNKHMSTTSYITPEMAAMGDEAKAKGLTFINECGVDPGLDHMSAMRVIHGVEKNGGKVVSFKSYCGGIPAPEANTNPIGYKFSWAPRGVLVAATNDSRYLENGNLIDWPGSELFKAPELIDVEGAGTFEGYPNRDAMPYKDLYGLNDVQTMFRGTMRHPGHCESWYPWVQLGLFDPAPRADIKGLTYLTFMETFVNSTGNIKKDLAATMGVGEDAPTIAKLEWLGLFEDTQIPLENGGNIDVMAVKMLKKCPFLEGERDMLAMKHEFVVDYADRSERIVSTLVDFGIPGGDSSMARTVSLPVAIATRMVLQGIITTRGVVAPIDPAIYNPILDELTTLDIVFNEKVVG